MQHVICSKEETHRQIHDVNIYTNLSAYRLHAVADIQRCVSPHREIYTVPCRTSLESKYIRCLCIDRQRGIYNTRMYLYEADTLKGMQSRFHMLKILWEKEKEKNLLNSSTMWPTARAVFFTEDFLRKTGPLLFIFNIVLRRKAA